MAIKVDAAEDVQVIQAGRRDAARSSRPPPPTPRASIRSARTTPSAPSTTSPWPTPSTRDGRSPCSSPPRRSARSRSAARCSTCCSAVAGDHPDVQLLHAEVYAHPEEDLDAKAAVRGRARASPSSRAWCWSGATAWWSSASTRSSTRSRSARRWPASPEPAGNVRRRGSSDRRRTAGTRVCTSHRIAEPLAARQAARRRPRRATCARPRPEADDAARRASTAFPPLGRRRDPGAAPPDRRVAAAQRIVERTIDRAAAEVGERLAAIGHRHGRPPGHRARSGRRGRRGPGAASQAGRGAARAPREAEVVGRGHGRRRAEPVAPPHRRRAGAEPPARRRRWFAVRPRPAIVSTRRTPASPRASCSRWPPPPTRPSARGVPPRRATTCSCCCRPSATAPRRTCGWPSARGATWPATTPVEDVEAVVRRFDPQHQDALAVAQETVGVRAASTLLARGPWSAGSEGWRSLGRRAGSGRADRGRGCERLAERVARRDRASWARRSSALDAARGGGAAPRRVAGSVERAG